LDHDVFLFVITNSVRLTHREVFDFRCGVFEDSLHWDGMLRYLSEERIYFIIKDSTVNELSATTSLETNAFQTSGKI